jgi:predicted lipoprotein with Yx(FWY)xxD motif
VTLLVGAAALAVSLSAGVSSAAASPARMTARSAVSNPPIVDIAKRPVVGKILVTLHGVTLYRDTDDGPNDPTCTGSCAGIWPPLVLPAGAKMAKGGPGVTGLGTVKIANGDLQVTFNKEPLYTFVDDSGHSVNGNGDGPFEVVHP